MDILEQVGRDPDTIRSAIHGELSQVWTALPVIIPSASDGHTTAMQSAVNQMVYQQDGTLKSTPMTAFGDAPVHFIGGGGVTSTHPVASGDEGIAIFLSRSQDLWHQNGGVQDPIDSRSHSLSDCRFIPGGRSTPRKMNPAPSTTSAQNRSDDGNHVHDVHPTNGLTSASTKKIHHVSGSTSDLMTPDGKRISSSRIALNCGTPGSSA